MIQIQKTIKKSSTQLTKAALNGKEPSLQTEKAALNGKEASLQTAKAEQGVKGLPPQLYEKYLSLAAYFQTYADEGICIAYSGGVDSTLLLKVAADVTAEAGSPAAASQKNSAADVSPKNSATALLRTNPAIPDGNVRSANPAAVSRPVLAVILETQLHPHGDTQQAVQMAQELHSLPKVIHVDEFQDSAIMENPPDRCYRCKRLLFSKLKELAADMGCRAVFDGTNADDKNEYRPGMRVLKELGIHSPLLSLGITKKEVRAISAALHLPTASAPSTPCLATRLPYHTHLDRALLTRIHEGEMWLRSCGFYNVRLRFHAPILRIEVDCSDFERLLAQRANIIAKMKALGFPYITLDLEGFRSGSMDIPQ